MKYTKINKRGRKNESIWIIPKKKIKNKEFKKKINLLLLFLLLLRLQYFLQHQNHYLDQQKLPQEQELKDVLDHIELTIPLH